MSIAYNTFFTFSLIIFAYAINYLSKYYTLDKPNYRKIHKISVSQIGGIIFVPIFLFYLFFYTNIPSWFLIGGTISFILGIIDDNFNVHWSIKLAVQLSLLFLIIINYLGMIDGIQFFHFFLSLPQYQLILLFTIWFIGIFNAVNLIDGLDGLAASFIIISCFSIAMISGTEFSSINIFLSVLLLGFLSFNQRPAKVFMGDSGSLFLGYYCAILPLLAYELNYVMSSSIINMTPFIIIFSFLIADTTRVFFTRIISGKSPMTPDTIHLHHLVLQRSGSYLATIFVILSMVIVTGITVIADSSYQFGEIGMLIFSVFLFLFILTPPAPTYVNLITKIVSPVYKWDRPQDNERQWKYLGVIVVLLLLMLSSVLSEIAYNSDILIQALLSVLFFLLFILINNDKVSIVPPLQVFSSIFLFENYWSVIPSFFTQLFILLLIVTIAISIFTGINGIIIKSFSTLDLLLVIITLSGIILFLFNLINNIWIFLATFAFWFSFGSIIRYAKYKNLNLKFLNK